MATKSNAPKKKSPASQTKAGDQPTKESAPPVRTPEEDYSIAVHESGHAVAALAAGYQIKCLTLVPVAVDGGWYVGRIDLGKGFPSRRRLDACSRKVAEGYFVYSFAGFVAESLFGNVLQEEDFEDAYDEDWGDIGYSSQWMERFAAYSVEAYRHIIWERTRAFLLDHERLLKGIADSLVERREMNEVEVGSVARKFALKP